MDVSAELDDVMTAALSAVLPDNRDAPPPAR